MNPESADLSTRDSILYLLKTQGPSTVSALSEKLGITPMGVRQHLRQLEAQGLVQVTQKRGKVGRPGHVYSLTEAGDESFIRNYHELVEFLLDTLTAMEGSDKVDSLFRQRAKQFIEQHKPDFVNRSLEERLALLAKLQDEAGYLTVLDQQNDRFVLTEHNCTIARVASRYTEVCKYELDSFQELLGDDTEVQRVQCISSGDNFCQYVVRSGKTNSN